MKRIRQEWRLFVLGGIAAGSILTGLSLARTGEARDGILGGPFDVEVSAVSDTQGTTVNAISPITITVAEDDLATAGFVIVREAALLEQSGPLAAIAERDGLLTYVVKSGDTVSSIAARFDISVDTIAWANSGIKTDAIMPGEKIAVLPISGVTHVMREGETLESIAIYYRVDPEKVRAYNKPNAQPGDTVIVPDAAPLRAPRLYAADLPDLGDYFTLPTRGWNWGRLHDVNAVDIANACGTAIYAAAEGLVEEISEDTWSSGYGKNIIIKHPNGTKTRYAHNSRNVVAAGEYVSRGDLIAYIGNTGNVHGPTGCHLHFEVVYAKNPFVK